MVRKIEDLSKLETTFLFGYAFNLALRLLQTNLYSKDRDIKEFVDRILEITLEKEIKKG